MGYVQIRKIGNFRAFIGLSIREFIRQIGEGMEVQKCPKEFGMNRIRRVC